ncbi:MAG: hypothetical protein OEV49_09095 [candidate division Zixibacteria bacterium]|nr:hypothetical protein [candidate division Zixibacteria bacterium]MDH3935757.1 hypothetical protein [candidate division Zixibacteria bacterium]
MSKDSVLIILLVCLVVPVSVTAQSDPLPDRTHIAVGVENPIMFNLQSVIDGCCVDIRGNIDGDPLDQIDISDLVYLVDYMFSGGPEPPCIDETDVDASGGIDISDLVYVVDYMFTGGPPPGACPSLISIVGLQPDDDTVNGTANVLDTTQFQVVLWAKTNQWYVQPTVADPYTHIQGDGSWSNYTHPWDRIVALLVDSSYLPESIRDYHPSLDSGVIGWDEYPGKSIRFVNWSNFCWQVKTGDLVGPGPNYFSDDTANVWIDQQGRMHLKIDSRDSKWYCAELVLDHSLGYGVYSFKLDSRVDSLDFNTILGCFVYETTNQEFDIEFSQRLANPFNAQFVIQPWYTSGNIEFFNMPNSTQTSHSWEWRSDSIVFQSWNGHADTPTPTTLIHTWTYTGEDITIPGGERMRFNLYLYGGDAPTQGTGDEVIITSFEYSE